jgi:hypothetical protein
VPAARPVGGGTLRAPDPRVAGASSGQALGAARPSCGVPGDAAAASSGHTDAGRSSGIPEREPRPTGGNVAAEDGAGGSVAALDDTGGSVAALGDSGGNVTAVDAPAAGRAALGGPGTGPDSGGRVATLANPVRGRACASRGTPGGGATCTPHSAQYLARGVSSKPQARQRFGIASRFAPGTRARETLQAGHRLANVRCVSWLRNRVRRGRSSPAVRRRGRV